MCSATVQPCSTLALADVARDVPNARRARKSPTYASRIVGSVSSSALRARWGGKPSASASYATPAPEHSATGPPQARSPPNAGDPRSHCSHAPSMTWGALGLAGLITGNPFHTRWGPLRPFPWVPTPAEQARPDAGPAPFSPSHAAPTGPCFAQPAQVASALRRRRTRIKRRLPGAPSIDSGRPAALTLAARPTRARVLDRMAG
jgi:hypothetical protein